MHGFYALQLCEFLHNTVLCNACTQIYMPDLMNIGDIFDKEMSFQPLLHP